MEIKRLPSSSLIPFPLDDYGYTTKYKYQVNRLMKENNITITLELVTLDTEFNKLYPRDQSDFESYDRVLPMGYSFGAFVGDKLVGITICEPQEWNNTLFMWELYVASEYRGRHIGRALINKITELAKADGYRAIRLETQNTNVPAIMFYTKCGFMIDGIELSFYSNKDTESGEVALFMIKKLSDE